MQTGLLETDDRIFDRANSVRRGNIVTDSSLAPDQ